jgi:hypothetical protein
LGIALICGVLIVLLEKETNYPSKGVSLALLFLLTSKEAPPHFKFPYINLLVQIALQVIFWQIY